MEEDDFSSCRITPQAPSSAHSHTALRRALAVFGTVGLLVGFAVLGVEYQFWWLSVTGRRAEARVTARQEHVVGRAYTMLSAGAGRSYPIVETEFQYTLTAAEGDARQGSFRVSGSSQAYGVGDTVGVMYPRFSDGAGQPSAWGFYASHDAAWYSLTLIGAASLGVGAVCWCWRCRTRSDRVASETRIGTEPDTAPDPAL